MSGSEPEFDRNSFRNFNRALQRSEQLRCEARAWFLRQFDKNDQVLIDMRRALGKDADTVRALPDEWIDKIRVLAIIAFEEIATEALPCPKPGA